MLAVNPVFSAIIIAFAFTLQGCVMVAPPSIKDSPTPPPPQPAPQRVHALEPNLHPVGFDTSDVFAVIKARFALPDYRNADVKTYEERYRSQPMMLTDIADQARWLLPYISREVARRNLPGEIALLPIIESDLNPQAQSPTGAAGLWQFTANTGRHFGLRNTKWLDQRRDIEASTRAALEYLETLYRQFNHDWLLALTAYNTGGGRLNSLIQKSYTQGQKPRLKKLALPRESQQFVPRLIALRNVIENPLAFGVELPLIENRILFDDYITTQRVDHGTLAELCTVPVELINNLNAAQVRRITPPATTSILRVPKNCMTYLTEHELNKLMIARNPPRIPSAKSSTYVVQSGDSLWTIARRHGTSLATLENMNPALSNTSVMMLMPGQVISVPADGMTQPENTRSGAEVVHTVRSGDTLTGLAQVYGVSARSIARWNRISFGSTLALGQLLKIYIR